MGSRVTMEMGYEQYHDFKLREVEACLQLFRLLGGGDDADITFEVERDEDGNDSIRVIRANFEKETDEGGEDDD